MPRRKTGETSAADGDAAADVEVQQEQEPAGSEEVMVVLPAADEPVRYGGHILTDDGWVVEGDQPASESGISDSDSEGE